MSANGLRREPAARGAGETPAPLVRAGERAGTKELLLGALVVGVVSLVFFSLLAHDSMLWEQDQGSKAAKILYMIQHGELLLPFNPAATQLYQDAFFTFYYIVCAFIYKAFGGNLFGLMNQLSAVFGAVGLVGMTTAMRRAHGIRWYVSLPLFLSMPVVVLTNSYGNEVALSFGLFGAALGAASFGGKWAKIVSPVLMVLACFSRADMAVICPYWLGWVLLYGLGVRDKKEALRSILVIGLVFVAATLIYGAIVFRGNFPKSLGFGLGHTGWMLWIGNVTFPFCPSIVITGGIGALLLLFKRTKEGLLHLLLLLPLVVYFNDLYSPKYIIVMAIFYVVPVAWILLTARVWVRAGLVASIAFWWIFSLSNFGFFGPQQGYLWYLPTADNAIPTGSYLTFYNQVRKGFYHQRYESEVVSLDKTVSQLCAKPPEQPQVLWGSFNMHMLFYVAAAQGRFDDYRSYFDWNPELKLPDNPQARIYMIQPSYLWLKVLPPDGRARLDVWLKEGRLREVMSDGGGPFPTLIEVGPLVPAGTDTELGRRILFADQYYLGSLSTSRREMLEPYATLAWLPRSQFSGDVSSAVYADESFVALNQAATGGRIFGLHFPKAYLRFTKEDTRYWPPKSEK